MTTGSPTTDPLPAGLSAPLEKLVYLYVRERGRTSVYDLRDTLDVPQLRLYPTLGSLAKRGLVARRGDEVWLPEDRAVEARPERPLERVESAD